MFGFTLTVCGGKDAFSKVSLKFSLASKAVLVLQLHGR